MSGLGGIGGGLLWLLFWCDELLRSWRKGWTLSWNLDFALLIYLSMVLV